MCLCLFCGVGVRLVLRLWEGVALSETVDVCGVFACVCEGCEGSIPGLTQWVWDPALL